MDLLALLRQGPSLQGSDCGWDITHKVLDKVRSWVPSWTLGRSSGGEPRRAVQTLPAKPVIPCS